MIDFADVIQTYTGRQGCMCGCRGKHSWPEHAREHRPFYYKDDDGISDRGVKITLGRVNKVLAEVDWTDPEQVEQHYHEGVDGAHIYFVDADGRSKVVYTMKKVH